MTTMRDKLARKLIDLDPVFSGYHQSHLDAMYPKVDAILSVLEEPDDEILAAMSRAYHRNEGWPDIWQAAIRSIRKGGE